MDDMIRELLNQVEEFKLKSENRIKKFEHEVGKKNEEMTNSINKINKTMESQFNRLSAAQAKDKEFAAKQLEEKITDVNDQIKQLRTWIERQEESKDVKKYAETLVSDSQKLVLDKMRKMEADFSNNLKAKFRVDGI
jgi:spore cortex formation protein SpoVR/YcgB (stage V sporulation)